MKNLIIKTFSHRIKTNSLSVIPRGENLAGGENLDHWEREGFSEKRMILLGGFFEEDRTMKKIFRKLKRETATISGREAIWGLKRFRTKPS